MFALQVKDNGQPDSGAWLSIIANSLFVSNWADKADVHETEGEALELLDMIETRYPQHRGRLEVVDFAD